MSFRDPYQAYTENAVVGSSPLQLVVTLYQTAIRRTQEARECLAAGDIWGRARAITKASNILTELRASLNANAGEVSVNLDRLYRYMQTRLQEAHLKKAAEPLSEVEKLLRELLEAWEQAEATERMRTAGAPTTPAQQYESARSFYRTESFDDAPVESLTLSA
jgi:flagellar secretion chaperone FliS